MSVLFVHGAGGYLDDRPIADGLSAALNVPLVMPEISDEDMSYEAWASPIRGYIGDLGPDDVVVAHSFGASILVSVLAEGTRCAPGRATLLAMPDWSPDGWNVPEYAFSGSIPKVVLTLHHCRDDEVVPFEHLALGGLALPSARLVEHDSGGHQFDGLTVVLAAHIRDNAGSV